MGTDSKGWFSMDVVRRMEPGKMHTGIQENHRGLFWPECCHRQEQIQNEKGEKREQTNLIDEHAAGHGETCFGRKVAGYHDPQPSLRKWKLVWVSRQQLIHHDHWGFTVEIPCNQETKRSWRLCLPPASFHHIWHSAEQIYRFHRSFVRTTPSATPQPPLYLIPAFTQQVL